MSATPAGVAAAPGGDVVPADLAAAPGVDAAPADLAAAPGVDVVPAGLAAAPGGDGAPAGAGVDGGPNVDVVVEAMTAHHWPAVARIYAAGIATGNATFEHTVPSWEDWLAARLRDSCLVANDGRGDVIGWAALSPTSSRDVYRGVGGVSIYVDPDSAGRGVGTALLSELIAGSERAGLWTLEAGIFPENASSIALHERCGFRLVGVRRRVGQMQDGCWRDVLLYERRSQVVGPG